MNAPEPPAQEETRERARNIMEGALGTEIKIALSFVRQAAPCLLCCEETAGVAAFIPNTPLTLGKARFILYYLCGNCWVKPSQTDDVERKLLARYKHVQAEPARCK
jgi:hypothetical protein